MRVIKFRAWDNKNNRMIQFEPLSGVWDCEANTVIEAQAIDDDQSLRPPGNDCVLMQYTGLKDKNDCEIYEGDIISHSGAYSSTVTWTMSTGNYDEGWVGFNLSPDYDYDGEEVLTTLKTVEVIGNIHEHPELLKGVV